MWFVEDAKWRRGASKELAGLLSSTEEIDVGLKCILKYFYGGEK